MSLLSIFVLLLHFITLYYVLFWKYNVRFFACLRTKLLKKISELHFSRQLIVTPISLGYRKFFLRDHFFSLFWRQYNVQQSLNQCCGSGSVCLWAFQIRLSDVRIWSFSHQAKIVRKTLIPTVFWLLYDFLSLKQNNFCCRLSGSVSQRCGSGSVPICHGSETLLWSYSFFYIPLGSLVTYIYYEAIRKRKWSFVL